MNYSIVFYIVLTCWELYLFATQRASLEFSRDMNVSRSTGNLMLPLWYGTLWPNKITRWILIYFIFLEFGWILALVLLAVPLIATTFVPIPYKHLLPQFEKVLHRDISRNKMNPQLKLYSNLQSIREKLGMPKKDSPKPTNNKNT